MNDQWFKDVAIQKVGKNGYTALYERGEDGKWRTWAHTNPKITAPNLDDMSKLEKPLGASFPGFWKILTGVTPPTRSRATTSGRRRTTRSRRSTWPA